MLEFRNGNTSCAVADLDLVFVRCTKPESSFNVLQNGNTVMLYDQQTNRSVALEAWQWRNELNAETAERDAARDMEDFLGFSGDGESVPAVSMRLKTLYLQEPTLLQVSLRRLHQLQ